MTREAEDETMRQRIARAMSASKAWPAVFQAGAADELARAALEAIRRPTETMAIAGRATSLYPARTWARMVEAAIEEGGDGPT